MVRSYRNRNGAAYYLPEFGPPVRWVKLVLQEWRAYDDAPSAQYFECDAENACSKSLEVWADGRFRLAYPGGLDGDHLPEGPMPVDVEGVVPGVLAGVVSQQEFDALWAAFFRLAASSG